MSDVTRTVLTLQDAVGVVPREGRSGGRAGTQMPFSEDEYYRLVDELGVDLRRGMGRDSKLNLLMSATMRKRGAGGEMLIHFSANPKTYPEVLYTPGNLKHLLETATFL